MVLQRFDRMTKFLTRHDLFFYSGLYFIQINILTKFHEKLDKNCALWSVLMVLLRFDLVT